MFEFFLSGHMAKSAQSGAKNWPILKNPYLCSKSKIFYIFWIGNTESGFDLASVNLAGAGEILGILFFDEKNSVSAFNDFYSTKC